ncbi:MAG: hypothetical protein LCH67_06525 [Bacteroidetes bacterium]|nr:hypothetical protein [Bacteroidota bacterium]
MRIFGFLFFVLISITALGQTFKEKVPARKYIIVEDRVDTLSSIKFIPYSQEKISLNTMIWTFKPNGRIEYDYQSSEDIEACAGVDFLDLDVDACFWRLNPATHTITLTLKGGYSSIDDFVLKNEYDFKNESEGFSLVLKKKILYKNLNPDR